MGLFKISAGPWKRLFSGLFEERDVEIYSNQESVLLALIYEKEKGKISGAVVELFKVLASVGDTESFVDTLPREVLVLTKHTKKETIRYFLLASEPTYVEWKEEGFINEVDKLLEKLKTSSALVKDVSKAYNLSLKELSECENRIKEAFFSQPLLIPLVTTASHPSEIVAAAAAEEIKTISKGEIVLGITKEKNPVVEPIKLFMKTVVFGGDAEARKHLLHVLIESALLSNSPVVVVDWENEFLGLSEATKKRDELAKYKVEADPIGFPAKEFKFLEDIWVDLNFVNVAGLSKLFGVGDKKIEGLVESVVKKGKVRDMEQLIERVDALKPDDKFTEYAIKKAVRVLRVLDTMYEHLFGGENKIEDISKNWPKAIGRAGIIEMKGADEKTMLLVLHSLIKGMLEFYKNKGKSLQIKAFVVVPETSGVLPIEATNILQQEIEAACMELAKYGVGIIFSADKRINFSRKIADASEANLEIISGNDIGVQIKDRKRYRVFVRPSLSRD